MTMQDRMRLWSVPAVFDSLVTLDQVGIDQAMQIVSEAYAAVERLETMPRSVCSWVSPMGGAYTVPEPVPMAGLARP
jgi:hypothetical protein